MLFTKNSTLLIVPSLSVASASIVIISPVVNEALDCGEVIDIKVDTTRIVDCISQDYKFSIDKSDLVFSGSCESCSNK